MSTWDCHIHIMHYCLCRTLTEKAVGNLLVLVGLLPKAAAILLNKFNKVYSLVSAMIFCYYCCSSCHCPSDDHDFQYTVVCENGVIRSFDFEETSPSCSTQFSASQFGLPRHPQTAICALLVVCIKYCVCTLWFRFLRNNLLLAGLWYDKKTTTMSPFTAEMNN